MKGDAACFDSHEQSDFIGVRPRKLRRARQTGDATSTTQPPHRHAFRMAPHFQRLDQQRVKTGRRQTGGANHHHFIHILRRQAGASEGLAGSSAGHVMSAGQVQIIAFLQTVVRLRKPGEWRHEVAPLNLCVGKYGHELAMMGQPAAEVLPRELSHLMLRYLEPRQRRADRYEITHETFNLITVTPSPPSPSWPVSNDFTRGFVLIALRIARRSAPVPLPWMMRTNGSAARAARSR